MAGTNFPAGVKSRGVPVEGLAQIGKVWSANTWFVNAGIGNDANSGLDTSLSGAFATISQAISAASAGDTIYIADGAYTDNLIINKARLRFIGESKSGVVVTGAANATDTAIVSASEVQIYNITWAAFDTGADESLISVTSAGDGLLIFNCQFVGAEYQVETNASDNVEIHNCHFITPDDTTDGACIKFEDSNDCKVMNCSFNVDNATDGIIHHDADNLVVAFCTAVGDDDTGASTGAFVFIEGSDATSELMVHHCNAALFAALIAETSTLVAAHGLGTSDLANTVNTHGNDAEGCTTYFDTTGLT